MLSEKDDNLMKLGDEGFDEVYCFLEYLVDAGYRPARDIDSKRHTARLR